VYPTVIKLFFFPIKIAAVGINPITHLSIHCVSIKALPSTVGKMADDGGGGKKQKSYDITHLVYDDMTVADELAIKKFDLSSLLDEICTNPSLLATWLREKTWQSLHIDYARPHIDRLYLDVQVNERTNLRVCLHYFLPPNDTHDAQVDKKEDQVELMHNHPWSAAFRIVHIESEIDVYKHEVAFNYQSGHGATLTYLTYQAGQSYAMAHPWLWHRVYAPRHGGIFTVMVQQKTPGWTRLVNQSPVPSFTTTTPTSANKPMDPEKKVALLAKFCAFFPLQQEESCVISTLSKNPKFVFELVLACDEKWGIAKNNIIPWSHTPEGKADMKQFKQLTLGRVCIIGRRTFHHILSKRLPQSTQRQLLPGRTVIVISNSLPSLILLDGMDSITVFCSVHDALLYCSTQNVIPMICGGRDIYLEALKYFDSNVKIHMTHIPGDYECDVAIPEIQSYL
jgi:dihydrofolate reductase